MCQAPPTAHTPMSQQNLESIPVQGSLEDRLMAAFVSLAVETYLLRERVLTLEHMLASRGVIDANAVESHEPTSEEMKRRDADLIAYRDRVLAELIRPEH